MTSPHKKRIAVIGAGISGLVASHILSGRPDFEHTVFERNSDVGGMWIYSDEAELDNQGHRKHSAIYKDLIANFPKALMEAAGHPWPSDEDSLEFATHPRILKYIRDIADKNNLRQHIRTSTEVKSIKPVSSNEKFSPLQLTIENVHEKSTEDICFDAVLICVGIFNDPYVPPLSGLQKFQGQVLHSCQFRTVDPFVGKNVVVVGGGFSGIDIAIDVAAVATSLVVCVSDYDTFNLKKQYTESILPSNMKVETRIASFLQNGIILSNGTSLTADVVIFCTGYKYYYPFIHPDCGITVEDFKISPLYKHTICTKHPNIVFIATAYMPLWFSAASWQVPLALKIFDGSLQLPSEEEMNADKEAEMNERKKCDWYHGREDHHFLSKEFPPKRFFADLCKLGNLPPYPVPVEQLGVDIIDNTAKNAETYRTQKYTLEEHMYKYHL